MTEAEIIRSAASEWLRDHEEKAKFLRPDEWQRSFGWTDWQINNMQTYLAMVDEP